MHYSFVSRTLLRHCVKSQRILGISKCPTLSKYPVQIREFAKLIFPLKLDEEYESRNVTSVPEDFRHVYPDFLPDPKPEWRNRLREKIEREDMLNRRSIIDIPEFYSGSILAVTVSDPNASGKSNRFVGICISRGGSGLRSWFILRNVVDHQGVEILYEMYCPLLQTIEVLKLEKRLDEDLTYLRDCLPQYSTFSFEMEADPIPYGAPVPVNPIKAVLKPRPWHERWERKNLKGLEIPRLPFKFMEVAKIHQKPWEKFDLMKEYRATIPEEEQARIYGDMGPHMMKLEASRRRVKKIKMQKERIK